MKTLWLALPAYNEERSLLERCVPVARALAAEGHAFRVLVVDDGSRDRTIEAAKGFCHRLGIEVVPHEVNRGLGAALRTCLTEALARAGADDAIATMDADNTQDPDRLVEESGFTCRAEVLLKLGRGGACVAEWRFVLRYDRKEGATKMKVLRTIRRYFTMAFRIRGAELPRVVDPS